MLYSLVNCSILHQDYESAVKCLDMLQVLCRLLEYLEGNYLGVTGGKVPWGKWKTPGVQGEKYLENMEESTSINRRKSIGVTGG